MDTIDYVPLVVITICSILASVSDIRKFKVYNALTFPCFFAGLIFFSATQGWAGLGYSMLGAVISLVILIIPYSLGGLGAGDVKFVMAIGTWLGPQLVLPAIIIGSLATGVYSLFLITAQRGFGEAWFNIQLMFLRLSTLGKSLSLEDEFESVQAVNQTRDRRSKLIPFSAMFSLGVFATIVLNLMFFSN